MGACALAAGAVLLVALLSNDAEPRRGSAADPFRGIYETGFEYSNFRDCEDGMAYWLDFDRAAVVPQDLTGSSPGPARRTSFYMEFEGRVTQAPGASYGHLGQWRAEVTVTEIHGLRAAEECP